MEISRDRMNAEIHLISHFLWNSKLHFTKLKEKLQFFFFFFLKEEWWDDLYENSQIHTYRATFLLGASNTRLAETVG
jgi:hypothetical protein